MRLLIASTNRGKIREFAQMLHGPGSEYTDLASHPEAIAPDETGRTFRANAVLKATYYALRFDTWALADDSGLAVDALSGNPGVHSARWAEINGAGKGPADNNSLLLRQMARIAEQRRTARFICVLALADPQGRVIFTAMDDVEGRILRAPRGGNGFGYDPLFLIDRLNQSLAELSPEAKHAISHRGKALVRMRKLMAMLD